MLVIMCACQVRCVRVHALDLPRQRVGVIVCVCVCGVAIRLSATPLGES